MFIITNHVAETLIIALSMSIIPDGSIIPSRAVGTPIASWISADGANGVPNSHHWGMRAAKGAQNPVIADLYTRSL